MDGNSSVVSACGSIALNFAVHSFHLLKVSFLDFAAADRGLVFECLVVSVVGSGALGMVWG